MKVTFFKSIAQFLQKDISLTLSLSYIALIAIGIIFNSAYYLCFRINIIQYSDISDFLLAPFRDPFILIFTIATTILIHYMIIFDEWLEKKYPKLHHSMNKNSDKVEFLKKDSFGRVLFMIVTYVCIVATIYAKFQTNRVKNGYNPYIHIITKDNHFEPTDTLYFIGKNNGFTFLYNKSKKQTNVIPMSDVLRIEVDKK